MLARLTSVDQAPDELYEQLPVEADLLRKLHGPDRPDYWLAKPRKPLRWLQNGSESQVTHLVLAARWVGGEIKVGVVDAPINIAYVVDATLLQDQRLDFGKCAYVAIGTADVVAAA